jgi:outer membrane protein TolC
MREANLPNVGAPTSFPSANTPTFVNVESLPYVAWWEQFKDPVLNQLIESAINNNLDLQAAVQNLNQARGQLRQVELGWIPNIDGYMGYSTNPALGDIGSFYGAWPTYTLNIANNIQNQRYAGYQKNEVEAMVQGVRLTLIGQVCASYFTLIAQEKQLYLLRKLDQDITDMVSLITQQQKIGLDSNINVASIQSKQKQIHAQIASVEHNIRISNNALRYLIDENPGDIEHNYSFDYFNFNQIKPMDLPANVLANRPDIIMAYQATQRAHAAVGVSYSTLFPSIQLDKFFGAGAGNGSTALPTQYATMVDSYLLWGLNPSVFGQIEAQKGAYYSQIYQYIQTVRKALRDTDNSLSANIKISEQYKSLDESLKIFTKKIDLQKGLYKSGLISRLNVLEYTIDLDTLKIVVNQAKLEQAMSLVNVYQELAGGYKFTYASESQQIQSQKYLTH